jgi:hypothetical protein
MAKWSTLQITLLVLALVALVTFHASWLGIAALVFIALWFRALWRGFAWIVKKAARTQ